MTHGKIPVYLKATTVFFPLSERFIFLSLAIENPNGCLSCKTWFVATKTSFGRTALQGRTLRSISLDPL